jgi:DNA (cytosine-5)-methyltransferase 1
VKFLSICSGIEAASVAWEPLGWEAVAFSEIEPFPSAVLAHHYPSVPNLGDMTKFDTWPEEIFLEADLIVGGPPCQAFSVAGNREGLADDRGNLTLVYVQLINHADLIRKKHGKEPVIAFYENVPGLFSDKTNAFGCLLGALAGEDGALLAPGGKWTDAGCVSGPQRTMAWRLFDAQYFGLAQRRRRVFLVASARDGFNPAEILFEREGVRRDLAPSRETGQATPTRFVPSVAHCLETTSHDYSRADGFNMIAQPFSIMPMNSGKDYKARETDISQPLMAGGPVGGNQGGDFILQAIPIHDQATRFAGKRGDKQDGKGNGLGIGEPGAPMNTLTKGDRHAVATQTAVRRLLPEECESLQGFPRGYTNIPWRGKPEAPDGPRYKALGNSWAVPNVRWIGAHIDNYLKGEVK